MKQARMDHLVGWQLVLLVLVLPFALEALEQALAVDGQLLLSAGPALVLVVAAFRTDLRWTAAAVLTVAVADSLGSEHGVAAVFVHALANGCCAVAGRWLRRGRFGVHSLPALIRLWIAWGAGVVGWWSVIAVVSAIPGIPSEPHAASLLPELTGMYAIAPLMMALLGRQVRPDRGRTGLAWALLGVAGAALTELALMDVLPEIALISVLLIVLSGRHLTDLTAATVPAAAALVAVVVLMAGWSAEGVDAAQAGLITASLLIGGVHAQARHLEAANDELARRGRRMEGVVAAITKGVVLVGPGRRVELSNEAADTIMAPILDGRPHTVFGGEGTIWVDPDHTPVTGDALPGLKHGPKQRVGARTGDGSMRWLDISTRPIDGGTLVLTVRDCTEDVEQRWKVEAETAVLRHEAHHDGLTGLLNRVAFLQDLQRARASGDVEGLSTGVLYVDLNRFKQVNDEHSHAVGDEVLVMFGVRLRSAARATDVVARIGGDEFVVLCPGLPPEDADRHLAELAQRIAHAVDGRYRTSAGVLDLTASIGLAVVAPGEDADVDVLGRADAAMFEAKRRRRGDVVSLPSPDEQHPTVVRHRRSVYVVEDDPAMRLLAERLIEREPGLRVVGSSGDPDVAFQEITALSPDIVLSDIMMPGQDGGMLAERIRQANPGQRILFWSATSEQQLHRLRDELDIPYLQKGRPEALTDKLLEI